MSLMTVVFSQQQRPVPPTFTRSGQGRVFSPLELEPHQPVPQPFRRVSLPLYRGRGFSMDGQEPKPTPLIQQTFQPKPAPIENNEFNQVGKNNEDSIADEIPQPTRQALLQQQIERGQQQQQVDRIQLQPEKQFTSFRPQVNTFVFFFQY